MIKVCFFVVCTYSGYSIGSGSDMEYEEERGGRCEEETKDERCPNPSAERYV
jgi:hypothetical protein